MNLIILGPQGSGKGTQAKLLAQKFGLKHIPTGSLLREEVESGSKKGKLLGEILDSGELAPFENVVEVLEPAMLTSQAGFILDGTPRNLKQTEYLDWYLKEKGLKIDKVILINIPREESITRLKKRATIEHRTDDTEEGIRERLRVYEKDTLPVVENYRRQGILLEIDGTPDIQTVFKDIVTKIENSKND